MDHELEHPLMRQSETVDANVARTGDTTEAIQDENDIADVDTCIQQSAEALRAGRESVARSFYAQTPLRRQESGSDPRSVLREGRERILEQIHRQTTGVREPTVANYPAILQGLNHQLESQLADLAQDLLEGRTQPEVFKVQIRAVIEIYRTSVERLFTPVTINIR